MFVDTENVKTTLDNLMQTDWIILKQLYQAFIYKPCKFQKISISWPLSYKATFFLKKSVFNGLVGETLRMCVHKCMCTCVLACKYLGTNVDAYERNNINIVCVQTNVCRHVMFSF